MTLEERVVRAREGKECCSLLIKDYLPLIKKEASRIHVKGMDYDDKVNYLAFLFYENIFKFDENRGLKFLTMTITDMRFRLLNANRAANSIEKGGKAEFVSLDKGLCLEDKDKYITAIKSSGHADASLTIQEILSVVEETSIDWNDLMRKLVMDYLTTGDKIADVRRRHNAEHISYPLFRNKLRIIKKELQKRGYQLYA